MKFSTNRSWLKSVAMLIAATVSASIDVFAAEAPKLSELDNTLAIVLIIVIVGLLIAISLLAHVLIGAAKVYVDKLKEQRQKEVASSTSKIYTVVAAILLSATAFAADEPAKQEVSASMGGLATSSLYALVTIAGLELLILIVLALFLKKLISKDKPVVVKEAVVAKEQVWKKWWAKMNSFKPAEEEAALVLNHNYDGIRELDNKLPPWWLYSFYACIIFAFVYLYRYHVSHSAPSSIQEFEVAMAKADVEKEEYLKKSANNIDENTVTLLTDATALAEGKKIFLGSCAACHGPEGQGIVGPNLTDDFWLHKGSVKDVFKTVKYGVPEKGMKAWKDDFSPVQMAQLSSYIKSLKGSKPANAKEPQGDLYTEERSAPKDSAKIAAK